jgi:dTDP-glucose 4,6-dehydratase
MIIVTGGAGFIGSNFVLNSLVDRKFNGIVNIDKLTYAGNLTTLNSLKNDTRHIFIQGDIGDRDLVSRLLNQFRPSAIINFAAESHVDRSIHGPGEFIDTNIVGTFNLLESARSYYDSLQGLERDNFRFLQVSTDEVYGTLESNAPAFTEKNTYEPNSPYAASKAASDHLVRAWFHTYGLPVLTTNCSNNYGPYQFPEKLIPLVIHNALKGKSLPIYGDGLQVRDWLYVEDHCLGIQTVLNKGILGETYNIGGNNEKTNISVVQLICSLLDQLRPKVDQKSYSEQITYVADRPGHDRRYAINASKIAAELGWKPKETFDTGIRKTVQWYLDHQDWVEGVVSGSYRDWVAKQYVQ